MVRCVWLLSLAVPAVEAVATNATTPQVRGVCDSIHGLQCMGDDIKDIGPVHSHEACCSACEALSGCASWTWNWKYGKHCYLKSGCSNPKYGDDAYHSGKGTAPGPSPPGPSPPGPPPAPTPANPLGIVPLPKRSDNFFLLIGDYGHEGGPNGCTTKVASLMKDYVRKQQASGKKALFVGALGDNFYSRGLKDASQWSKVWSGVYGVDDPSSPLHNVPWMGIMGNHDHGGADPGCPCGKTCKQISTSPHNFYMPHYYWNYVIPGVDVEIIGLDTNALDVGGLGGDGCKGHSREVCDTCGWGNEVKDYLNDLKSKGEQLLDARATASSAKTVLIMQHYEPERYGFPGKELKERFEGKNGGRAHVLSAYGHAHDQKCQGSRQNGCDIILSGGGGGWRGGGYFGFTAVHLTDDGGYKTVLETSEVRFSQRSCHWWGSGLGDNMTYDRSEHPEVEEYV